MIAADVGLLPFEYWLCVVVVAGSFFYAVHRRGRSWLPAFLTVLGTVVAWYMVEPIYFEDFLISFAPVALSEAYTCVLVFLVALTLLTPFMVNALRPRRALIETDFGLSAEQIAFVVILLWLCLLAVGIYRMGGDWQNALFPLYGRTGAHMWSRSAGSGSGAYGFLVSTGGYLYVLVLSLLGLLLTLTRIHMLRVVLSLCILLAWPYAFLQGSRNVALAVIAPSVIAYLLIGKRSLLVKTLFAAVALFGVDFLMRAMLELRNVGFSGGTMQDVEEAKHLGLNMASELAYIVDFLDKNILDVSWGLGYLAEALNVVPRALWVDKPTLGVEYAVARGFGGGYADIGVFATISTGMIGQGVLNFGLWVGPVVAAMIMATWIAVLTRLRDQGGAMRTALFLVGLGLTFNLGRDITLLVLFPFIFGYIGVRILEAREVQQRYKSMQRPASRGGWRRDSRRSASQGES